jgi:hypothetical protein
MTLHAYEQELPVLADSVEKAMTEELTGEARVQLLPFAGLLEPPDAAPRALGQADLDVVDAAQSFLSMDLAKAQHLIGHALEAYGRYLPQLARRGGGIEPLRDAFIQLAKIRYFDGDTKGAKEVLGRVFILDPSITFSSQLFPPQMRRTVLEARAVFDALGEGSVVVDSDPPGATVYVNGVKIEKPTPTDPIVAHGGPNLVTLNLRGWAPSTVTVEVSGRGKPTTTLLALARYPGNPLQPLARARLQLDTQASPPPLAEAAKGLGVDLVGLVRLGRAEDEAGAPRVRMVAVLYDARPARVIHRVERTVAESEVVPVSRLLAHDLLDGVRLDGVWIEPPPPARRRDWRDRLVAFRNSKYFWYVVGGVAGALVVGAAVGIGVAASENHGGRPGEQVVLLGGR